MFPWITLLKGTKGYSTEHLYLGHIIIFQSARIL